MPSWAHPKRAGIALVPTSAWPEYALLTMSSRFQRHQQGLAYATIIEGWTQRVVKQHSHFDRWIPARIQHHGVVGLQFSDGSRIEGECVDQVDIARSQRPDLRTLVGYDLEYEPIKIRFGGTPVGVVAHHFNRLSCGERGELERPRTYGCQVGRVGDNVRPFEDMLRLDGHIPPQSLKSTSAQMAR